MNPHTAAGIAQVIFYIPVTLYAQYIGIRCWKYGSRMACYMIMAFTIIRLVGGALVITVEKDLSDDNANMIKATYVLLNLGLVPLLAALDSLLSLITREVFPNNKMLRAYHHICTLLIISATGLLVTAASFTGQVEHASLQSILYKIGYFDFLGVFVVSVMLCMRIYLVLRPKNVKDHNLPIIKCLLLASPFLALRTAYGILGIFNATGTNMFTSMWSSLFGSATALSLMGLLPEYIVICAYLYILRYIVRTGTDVKRLPGGHHNGTGSGHELESGREDRHSHSSRHHILRSGGV